MNGLALSDLAGRINAKYLECVEAAQSAIDKAIEVGRLLCEAKIQVRHGEWAGWVKANCVFGEREAQRYMRAYGNREQIRHGASDFTSLRGAMAALSERRAVLEGPRRPEGESEAGKEEKLLPVHVIWDDFGGGFLVEGRYGPDRVFLSNYRFTRGQGPFTTTTDYWQAATFDTAEYAYETIDAWVKPGTLAQMSDKILQAWFRRYHANGCDYWEAVRWLQELVERAKGGNPQPSPE